MKETKYREPERMDISIFCSDCVVEIGYGYVGDDDGLILDYNGQYHDHAKKGHVIILRKRSNVSAKFQGNTKNQLIKEESMESS